jgi:hypothetical protein
LSEARAEGSENDAIVGLEQIELVSLAELVILDDRFGECNSQTISYPPYGCFEHGVLRFL